VSKYAVRLEPRAEDQLLSLQLPIRRRVIEKLKRLADWLVRTRSVRRLKGPLAGLYRVRAGDYRAIFAVDEDREVISVRRVGHRDDVCLWLTAAQTTYVHLGEYVRRTIQKTVKHLSVARVRRNCRNVAAGGRRSDQVGPLPPRHGQNA